MNFFQGFEKYYLTFDIIIIILINPDGYIRFTRLR